MPVSLDYEVSLRPAAQRLRREMTRHERHLWYDYLKNCPVQFRRQKQFGYYIVDFYCAACKLVVELDGSQHFEAEGREEDKARTEYLEGLGLTVLRFSNADVDAYFEAVCATIDREIAKRL